MFDTSLNTTHLVYLLQGLTWTIGLSALAFVFGGIMGLGVALSRVSSVRILRNISVAYVLAVQGTPLMILLFLIFFGLPAIGLEVSSLFAAVAGMMIYASAYLGEIWRGAIQSVPKAQWEAAECLALGRVQRMAHVILPQAVRIATPPTVGFLVQIVKNTSLVSVVGFVELSRAAQLINNSIFEPFIVYQLVALLYFAVCYPLSLWSRTLEQRSSLAAAH